MTTVLVTGASGFRAPTSSANFCEKVTLFEGTYIFSPVLYRRTPLLLVLIPTDVVSTVRSHNVARVSKGYESFGDRFAAVVVEDLVTSDPLAAVKGVDAIIHVASPLYSSDTPEAILETAVTGTTRILDAALVAGVKKLVITESIVSLAAPVDFWKDAAITEKSYSPLRREDGLKPGAPDFVVYSTSKSLSDITVRNFKRDHPDFDVATIHLSYVYGPLGSGQVYHTPATGTNQHVYEFIAGPPGRPVPPYDPVIRFPPLSVDVRDVARAHVLALKLPPSSESPKRFVLSTTTFTSKEAIELLAEKRPELKERLPVITGNEPLLGPVATLDTSKTESELGMRNYVKWQDTVLDTVDDLLRVEKELA
ncbi:NAD-P-binding protein [Lactarius indigo]|nr:NAD-P-binding protein [Lactarius indigo]